MTGLKSGTAQIAARPLGSSVQLLDDAGPGSGYWTVGEAESPSSACGQVGVAKLI